MRGLRGWVGRRTGIVRVVCGSHTVEVSQASRCEDGGFVSRVGSDKLLEGLLASVDAAESQIAVADLQQGIRDFVAVGKALNHATKLTHR